jgi:hypothetical protein
MALDPSIILGARAPQIDMSQFSPMNTLATAMKFKQAEQDSQLNALKIKEYERARAEEEGLRNYLSGGREMPAPDLSAPETRSKPDLSSPGTRRALATNFGKTGATFAKALSEQETAELTRRKTAFEVQQAKQKFIAQVQRDTSNNPSDANITAYKEDLVDNPLFSAAEKAQLIAGVDRILAMPVSERKAFMASQGASASELKPSYQQINRNGQTDLLQNPAFGGTPTTIGTFADVALPANVEEQKKRIARESRAVTNVQLPPQEKAEQADRGKMLVAEYNDISKAAKLAAKTLPSIDANLRILDKGFSTGFGTETKAAGASVLSALGVANAEKFATDAQIFQAKATEAVLQKQLEQKGPQTESDAKRIDAVGAQLGKTTGGNKFLLTTAKEQLKRDMEQRAFYDKWWKNNKTYDGAEDAWFAGEGGKSLFDRPALKQYAAPAESATAQIPTTGRAAPAAAPSLTQERAAAAAAIAAGAPAAAVRARFKQNTGQEF